MTESGLWVVPEMVQRLRAEWGLYHWTEFDAFLADRQITIHYHRRQDMPRAFHRKRTIYVRRSRSRLLTARAVWHEAGHVVAFPLNFVYWETLDWGEMWISKTEKRNSDFVRFFPVWDDDTASFLSQ